MCCFMGKHFTGAYCLHISVFYFEDIDSITHPQIYSDANHVPNPATGMGKCTSAGLDGVFLSCHLHGLHRQPFVSS
jgi:hypothetical protein